VGSSKQSAYSSDGWHGVVKVHSGAAELWLLLTSSDKLGVHDVDMQSSSRFDIDGMQDNSGVDGIIRRKSTFGQFGAVRTGHEAPWDSEVCECP
jgi:hypothetical protein